MRRISELVGKGTIISVEDLQAEIDERQEILDDSIPPILRYGVGCACMPPITNEARTEIVNEIAILEMESAWRNKKPVSSDSDIDPIWASGFIEGHNLGMKYERIQHQKNAAKERHKTNNEKRDHCILKADEIWQGDPTTMRIGEVVTELENDFILNRIKSPKPKTIRKWLKDAEKAGDLFIPIEASKSGAPLTSKI